MRPAADPHELPGSLHRGTGRYDEDHSAAEIQVLCHCESMYTKDIHKAAIIANYQESTKLMCLRMSYEQRARR